MNSESPQVFWVKHLTCIAILVSQEDMVEGEVALVSIGMSAREVKAKYMVLKLVFCMGSQRGTITMASWVRFLVLPHTS